MRPRGIKYTSHGENAEGSPIHIEFTAKYDGQDNPVTGSPDFDSIAIKRIDAQDGDRMASGGLSSVLALAIADSAHAAR